MKAGYLYARFDTKTPFHPKIAGLSNAAFRVWFSAVCFCKEHMSDGVIHPASIRLLPGFKKGALQELVNAGLLDQDGVQFRLHDFLDYQYSREEVENHRAKEAGRWHERQQGDTPKLRTASGPPPDRLRRVIVKDIGKKERKKDHPDEFAQAREAKNLDVIRAAVELPDAPAWHSKACDAFLRLPGGASPSQVERDAFNRLLVDPRVTEVEVFKAIQMAGSRHGCKYPHSGYVCKVARDLAAQQRERRAVEVKFTNEAAMTGLGKMLMKRMANRNGNGNGSGSGPSVGAVEA